ncbi:hypothetical protein [Yinghuangia soli]|uniref:Uncharacterized protein n=1 Tax=Yinghuangia soli TaxID=2908204 RepID=A0AA41Q6M7_9ACTN|nr:hypothetical protein [Yinghuangia soli]MCF2531162.1 hypothetical protein [Yinghuangia soli]
MSTTDTRQRRRWLSLKQRLTAVARDDSGYTTETIVVTAILVAIAIAVLAIFRTKLVAKVNGLNLGMGHPVLEGVQAAASALVAML